MSCPVGATSLEQRPPTLSQSKDLVEGFINGGLESAGTEKSSNGAELLVIDFDQARRRYGEDLIAIPKIATVCRRLGHVAAVSRS